MAGTTVRLDALLVDIGAARSRADARDLIGAGAVTVDGVAARKPSMPVGEDSRVQVATVERWVGRAALKLVRALELFGRAPTDRGIPAGGGALQGAADGAPRVLDPAGRRCLDVGASTGGFTEVLLRAGAAHVVALDVGHGQLVPALAADPRVEEVSGRNIRDVSPGDLGDRFDILVGDLSFISLRLVLPVLAGLVDADADVVLLVKPQFEVGRHRLGKNGVVRDRRARADAVRTVVDDAFRLGWSVHGLAPSPLDGSAGNREYLLWCSPAREGALRADEVEQAITRLDDEEDG